MSDFPFGIAFGPNEKTDSSGDLHEIKKLQQRIAELEAENERLTKIIQGKPASLGLIDENERLRAANIEFCTRLIQNTNDQETHRLVQQHVAALKGADDE